MKGTHIFLPTQNTAFFSDFAQIFVQSIVLLLTSHRIPEDADLVLPSCTVLYSNTQACFLMWLCINCIGLTPTDCNRQGSASSALSQRKVSQYCTILLKSLKPQLYSICRLSSTIIVTCSWP